VSIRNGKAREGSFDASQSCLNLYWKISVHVFSQSCLLAQQNQALQAGYTQALTAAQKQQLLEAQLGQTAGNLSGTGQSNLINAATVGGNLAGQTQALGLGDVTALSTLGGQQQTIAQNAQLFPLQKLAQQAALMKGYTVPTTSVQTFQGSPLSAATSLGALGAGFFTKNVSGTSPAGNLAGALGSGYDWLKNWASGTPAPTDTTSAGNSGYHDPTYGPPNIDVGKSWADYYNNLPSNSSTVDAGTNSDYLPFDWA